jgi:integrase
MINDGVVHEDFVQRLKHPESIQMLKVLKSRNDRRRETMRAAVRRQDHSVTIHIPDWGVPYIEPIVKDRKDTELLFAGLGHGSNSKLIKLFKTAMAEAGSNNIDRIGTHSGRKAFAMTTLAVSNGDMRATAQLVGHANVATTSSYTGRETNNLRELVQEVSSHMKSNVEGASSEEGPRKVRLSSRQNQVVPTSSMQEVQFGRGVNTGRRPFTDNEIKYMLLHAWTDQKPHVMHLLRAWVVAAVCSGLRASDLGRIQVQDVRAPDGSIYYNVLVKWTKGGLMWHQEELLGREAPHLREQRAEDTALRIMEQGGIPNMHKLHQAAMIGPDAIIREGWVQGDIARPGTGARVLSVHELVKQTSHLKHVDEGKNDVVREFHQFQEWKRKNDQDSAVDEDFGRVTKKPKNEPPARVNPPFTTPPQQRQQRDIRSFTSPQPTPQQDEKKEQTWIDERYSRLPGSDDRVDSIHGSVLDCAKSDKRSFKNPFTNLENYAILDGYYHMQSQNDWAGILRDYKDYFHSLRTSVSIKDKVRNMVLDMMSKEQVKDMRDHYSNMPEVREGINNINILKANKVKESNEDWLHKKWTARSERW